MGLYHKIRIMSDVTQRTDSDKKQLTQTLIEELNRGYVCPEDAGPAWRAAYEAGVDMALLEEKIAMTPAERLAVHQKALNQVLALRDSVINNET